MDEYLSEDMDDRWAGTMGNGYRPLRAIRRQKKEKNNSWTSAGNFCLYEKINGMVTSKKANTMSGYLAGKI